MADTETKAGAGTVPADELDVYRGWTSQQGPEPEPLPSTGPQKFVAEQLPSEEACEETGLRIPEHQMAESEEELDPADRVRLGNTGYASPLGVTANPEGAHIPGESREPENIRAAPELAQQPAGGEDGGAEGGTGADEEEADIHSMTKAELEEEAARRGVEVNSSMTKAEMIEAIEGAE